MENNMFTTEELDGLSKHYMTLQPKYDNLGYNLKQALEIFLKEKNIPFLSVSYRIKESASFLEKIERKKYKAPFESIEDICGLRIICYYQNDITRISEVVENECDVVEIIDKEILLQDDQFGYRSKHYIVKIKPNWLQAPNYRGLENLKAEIQIRTVLMHAWAEIQHKLAYKKETDIPKQFKRKLSRISAKLEEADEQFEDLKLALAEYKREIIEKTTDASREDSIELNLDSLQAYLDSICPDRTKDIGMTRDLLDELQANGISLEAIIQSYNRVKDVLPQIENEMFRGTLTGGKWAQVGMVRTVLDLANDEYFIQRHSEDSKAPFGEMFLRMAEIKKKWREKIKQSS